MYPYVQGSKLCAHKLDDPSPLYPRGCWVHDLQITLHFNLE